MTIRVLFLIDTLEVGGAEKSLLDIIPRMQGVSPLLCQLYPGSALKAAYERAGVPVVSLGLPGKYAFARAVAGVRRSVREHRADLIHSTLLRADLVARAVGAIERLPVVNSFVSDSHSLRLDRDRRGVLRAKYRAVRALDRLTAPLAAAFLANSAATKAANCRALGVPEGKVRVIHRGRDAAVFHPASPHPRGGTWAPGEGPVLVSVARLRESKGLADLLRAMPKVLARFPGTRLTIAGEGPARAALERLVDDLGLGGAVSLPGPRDDVADLLRAADVFISPSRAEGLPGAVVEAMLTALPVALSDIEVHREMLGAEPAGRLFRVGDVADLAGAIVSLLEDPAAARRLGREARERALALFDLEQVAASHVRLYADALGARRGRGSG